MVPAEPWPRAGEIVRWGQQGPRPGCFSLTLTDAGSSRHGHTVVVGVRADGGFQAVEVALLIGAGETHEGVGCGRRGTLQVTPVPRHGTPSRPGPRHPVLGRRLWSNYYVRGGGLVTKTRQ
jgi:hypothetical protein